MYHRYIRYNQIYNKLQLLLLTYYIFYNLSKYYKHTTTVIIDVLFYKQGFNVQKRVGIIHEIVYLCGRSSRMQTNEKMDLSLPELN